MRLERLPRGHLMLQAESCIEADRTWWLQTSAFSVSAGVSSVAELCLAQGLLAHPRPCDCAGP